MNLIKNKKAALAIVVLAVCVIFAAWGSTSVKADDALSLTLAESIALGVEKNPQIALAALSVDIAEVNYKEVKKASDKAKQAYDRALDESSKAWGALADNETYSILYIYPVQAEKGYQLAQKNLVYTTNTIKYYIETAYYGLQKAEKALQISKLAMNRSESQYKNAQAQEKQGLVAKFDVISAEANFIRQQTNYENVRNSVISARMALNQLLGLDIDTRIILKEEIKFEEIEAIDLNATLVNAKESTSNYIALSNNYDVLELTREYEQKYYAENTFIHQKAGLNVKEAEEQLKNAEITLEISIRNAYNQLTTAAINYKSLLTSVDLAKKSLDLADLRYREGLATIYDVQDADLNYQNIQLDLLDATHSYNLCKAAFTYGIF